MSPSGSVAFEIAGLHGHLPDEAWDRLEDVVRRFEAAWHAGQEPSLTSFLPGPADNREGQSERRALLLELIQTDLECRLKSGQTARVEQYLESYPELREWPAAILGLLAAEHRLRSRVETGLTLAEYRERFPQYEPTLRVLLGQAP
jgi:hypothetical protein